MAFRLTPEEKRQKSDLVEKLQEATDDFMAARATLNDLVDKSNSFIVEVKDRLQEEFDSKSEIWQGGEHSEAPQAMINEWDQTLEPSDETSVDMLNDLPEEA